MSGMQNVGTNEEKTAPEAAPAEAQELSSDTLDQETGIERVRILHLSDTHGLHHEIEPKFGLPDADILIHTGDFTSMGTIKEYRDFNQWLGQIRARGSFRAIVVITGNHEWKYVLRPSESEDSERVRKVAMELNYKEALGALLPNATHVLEHELAEIAGLRIWGSPWCPWQRGEDPDDAKASSRAAEAVLTRWMKRGGSAERFGEIPEGVDVLLTHGPPFGVFDRMEGSQHHWGGSRALRSRIQEVKPKAHLFGHLHEQRGVWWREQGGEFCGGVEYNEVDCGKELDAPPPAYPCQLISNNAQKNHPRFEGSEGRIVGGARLIIAERNKQDGSDTGWEFRLHD